MPRSDAYDVRNKGFREAFAKPFDLASVATPTAQLIPDEARKLEIEHYVEDVLNSQGARLHWLGSRSAKNVLLYFHGGGFALPPLNGHMLFWKQVLDFLSSKGHDTVLAVLEYSLTKGSRYPVQILQATESLRFILGKGYEPSKVVIGGDSAGGNMCLSTISVILHSFQGIEPLRFSGSLAGVLLISPWVSYSIESPSWKENEDKDAIPAVCETVLADAYVDPSERNNYSEPAQADVSWWTGIPAKSILNIYGGYECFRDDIAELGTKLQEAGNPIENVECPSQVHIDCILDLHCGMETGVMSTKVLEWLVSVL